MACQPNKALQPTSCGYAVCPRLSLVVGPLAVAYGSDVYMSHVVTFVETPLFTRLVASYLSDEAYGELQSHLVNHPYAGAVIPGSGGVRKLRWALPGRGKGGGVRVI